METSKLIETLRFCGDQESCCSKCPSNDRTTEYTATECMCDLMQKAADKLSELNEQNRWIPVADRLPEPGVRVLATDGEFVGEMYISKYGQWRRYNVNDTSLLMALDVLWWMPLPEPPRGE